MNKLQERQRKAYIEKICRIVCQLKGIDADMLVTNFQLPQIKADEKNYSIIPTFEDACFPAWKMFNDTIAIVLDTIDAST